MLQFKMLLLLLGALLAPQAWCMKHSSWALADGETQDQLNTMPPYDPTNEETPLPITFLYKNDKLYATCTACHKTFLAKSKPAYSNFWHVKEHINGDTHRQKAGFHLEKDDKKCWYVKHTPQNLSNVQRFLDRFEALV